MAERPCILARAQRRVDPAAGEEAVDDLGKGRRKPAIGLSTITLASGQATRLSLSSGKGALRSQYSRRSRPSQRLERVVPMRQARVGGPDRADQGVDHVVLDLVGEVAAGDRVRELAPAILQLLVLGERVGDQGEQADVASQHLGDGARRTLAPGAIVVLQQIEDLGAGQLPPVVRKPERPHGFVEQPGPGAPPGDRLLVQDALDLVVELVRAKAAHVADPGPITGEPLGCGELGLELLILDPVELERDEQHLRADLVDPLHRLKEATDLRILGVGRVQQLGVAHRAAEALLKLFVTRDHLGQRIAVELAEPALELIGERRRGGAPDRIAPPAHRARHTGPTDPTPAASPPLCPTV